MVNCRDRIWLKLMKVIAPHTPSRNMASTQEGKRGNPSDVSTMEPLCAVVGVGAGEGVSTEVAAGVGAMTVTAAACPGVTSTWRTTEVLAGSLAARISTRPDLSNRKEVAAIPALVSAWDCWYNLPSTVSVKVTTVPSGTGLPLLSTTIPVRTEMEFPSE